MRLLQHRCKPGCAARPHQARNPLATLGTRHGLFHKPATQHEDPVATLTLEIKLLPLAKPHLPSGHGRITATRDLSSAEPAVGQTATVSTRGT